MKTNYSALILLLTIFSITFLTSCPASPPLAPTEGFNPYLSPKAPENLEVSNGYADSITLSWDSVEGATSYMVWATPANQYGTTTQDTKTTEPYSKLMARGFELIDIVTEPTCKLKELNTNTAYIFSIIAMKTMGSKSTTSTVLYSEPSDFVEGSTAGDITLSAVANSKTVTLFWDISNLYSVLTNSKEKLALYDYRISIYKKLNSSNNWEEATKLEDNLAKEQHYSLGASSLEMDTLYDFKVRVEILDPEEENKVINTIESTPFTLITDPSPTPESVDSIKVNCGKERNQVTLTWTAPALSEHENLVSAFRVERAVQAPTSSKLASSTSSSLDWTELEASINNKITNNEDGTYSVTDTTLEDDTLYAYRVISGYQIDDKAPVFQDRQDATTIQNVYSLWVPQNITFNFTTEDNKSGILTASYTYAPPAEQGKVQFSVGGKTWTELDLEAQNELTPTTEDQPNGSIKLAVSIAEEAPLTYYNFYFKFALDDQEIFTTQSPTDLIATLGTTSASDDLIENFTATDNWVDAILLTWKEKTPLEGYTYEIYQDNQLLACDPTSDSADSTLKFILLKADPDSFHSYRVKVSKDSAFAVAETTGKTLARPTGLKATDGTSIDKITITWPQLEDAELNYALKYSYDNTNWENLEATSAGQATLPAQGEGKDGVKVSFKLVLTNKEQEKTSETKALESEIETGSVLGPALLKVQIENNGLDPDKITIKWDKVDGADYYRITRDGVLLEWNRDTDTYEDKATTILSLDSKSPLNNNYEYTVIPCLKLEDGTEIQAVGSSAVTGKLFAPPTNVKATKGQKGITLTWDAVEKATSYQIQKYKKKKKNGKVLSQTQPIETVTVSAKTTSYNETNSSLLNEKILYKICSIKEDGTASQWQNYYGTVKNSLGFDEAENIGYKLEKVPETSFEFKTAEITSDYYEDYVVVTWHMVPGATSYTLKSYLDETLIGTTTIEVASLSYSETDSETIDNGVSGKGYLSYNSETELYTYYDGTGDAYKLTNYKIIANNGEVSSGTTDANMTAYRQPTATYWINPILNILKPAFKAANSSFSGDWWENNVIAWESPTKTYSYPNSGMTFSLKTTGLDGSYTSSNNYLSITSYKDTDTKLTLATTEYIQFDITNEGGAGNLGTDPLKTIGYNGNGTISAKPEDTKLKPFTIQFKDINVNSASVGSYTVTLQGNEPETITDNFNFVRVLGD